MPVWSITRSARQRSDLPLASGAEYALDPRWSVKAEALYVDLGKKTTFVPGVPGGGFGTFGGRFETADTMWIVRAGVNYKFGG